MFSADGDAPVSFVVDNIASDYYHNDRDEFCSKDFPYAVPPWRRCFIEWIEPRTYRLGGNLLQKPAKGLTSSSVQVGAVVDSFDEKDAIGEYLSMFDKFDAFGPDASEVRERIGKADRMFIARFYGEANGVFSDWELAHCGYTNNSGEPLGHNTIGPGVRSIVRQIGLPEAMKLFGTFHAILCLSFTFCNCKNVALEDDTEKLQPPPKIMRRLKVPVVRRYRLKIDGKATSPSAGTGDCRSPAYHLCRGHFATYTAERPLFGRMVGKFWIPAHVKGKKSNGTVEKSYEA